MRVLFNRAGRIGLAVLLALAVAVGAYAKGNDDVLVHFTRTGHKYHTAGCRYLRQSDYTVTLREAKDRGLGPCSVCDPPR
jgi:hypothetical protein